jgi:hypothetical protein
MQFDTKSPTPKLLFSPVGAVSEDDLEVIARQAKSPAAEAAIKLNVYQMDSEEESSEAAPTKREVSNNTEAKSVDVSDVVKKWAKK